MLLGYLINLQDATFHEERFEEVGGPPERIFAGLRRRGFSLEYATEPALYIMQARRLSSGGGSGSSSSSSMSNNNNNDDDGGGGDNKRV